MTTITATPSAPDPPWPARDGTAGVYGITVAADLAGMSVQALRLYERKGLLQPVRTPGGTRRYSDNDITRLRRVADLIAEGVNLAGIARILGLEADNTALHDHNTALQERNTALHTDNSALIARNHQLRSTRRGAAPPRPGTTDPPARHSVDGQGG